MGVFIYVRNLMLVDKGKKRAAKQHRRASAKGPHLVEVVEVVRDRAEGRGAEEPR